MRTLLLVLLQPLPALAQETTPRPPEGPEGGVLVDRIVAVVGDRLVLASELALEEELRDRNVYTLEALRTRRQDAGRWLVDMAIIRGLAGDVRVYEPTPAEIGDALARLEATWEGGAAFLDFQARFGVDEDRLKSLIHTRLVVEHYIQRNVGLGASDEELPERFSVWIEERRQQVTIREIGRREP